MQPRFWICPLSVSSFSDGALEVKPTSRYSLAPVTAGVTATYLNVMALVGTDME